ncbi:MAG: ABC transporter permease [Gemmatimonadales bacterium]|nr:ABC transporter permease [Gemmatimonadales bacterium]
MSALVVVRGIVVRDARRWLRQGSRLAAGLGRPFLWVLFVGLGFQGIARVDEGIPYSAYAYPGGIAMGVLFGGMLTAISTVYDREFGMLRLMLASPAGTLPVLAGRTLSAALVGTLQGLVVLAAAPLAMPVGPAQLAAGALAVVAGALASAALGLLVASRLTSVENFGGVINVVLFPMLFLSGALAPLDRMPAAFRVAALANPVTYLLDLLRHALGQRAAFGVATDLLALALAFALAFGGAALLFDPERRFLRR